MPPASLKTRMMYTLHIQARTKACEAGSGVLIWYSRTSAYMIALPFVLEPWFGIIYARSTVNYYSHEYSSLFQDPPRPSP